jgi:peptidyl-prolyl cis-trans isomerase SurA
MILKYLNVSLLILCLMFSRGITLENKIILKINDEIITSIDIFNEIENLKFFNKNLNQLDNEEIYKIAVQSITKNKIKKNEIYKFFENFDVQNEDYLNEVIENSYKNLGFQDVKTFRNELRNKKISFENFKEKIQIDILWSQLIYSKYYNKIIIDEKKLKKQINSLLSETNSLLNLREIIFEVSDVEEIETKFNLIKNDIQKLGFEGAALKHSISNSSANGGNLGWIDERSINKQILNELKIISIKSITKPLRVQSGFLILQKFDEREIQKEINEEEELKKLIDFEKNQQLNTYSNLYYNKVKKSVKIDAP